MRDLFTPPAGGENGSLPWTVWAAPDEIAARLAQAIQAHGGRIFLGAEVEEVHVADAAPAQVVIRDLLTPEGEAGSRFFIRSAAVLSTIPMRPLIRCLGSQVPAQIHASSYYLSHLPVQAYACLVRKAQCLHHLTLHFRDRPYLRITEPRYFHPDPAPASHTVLVVEVLGRSPQLSSERWQETIAALKADFICDPSEIVEHQFLHAAYGHPILRKDGVEHLGRIRDCLHRFPRLALAGAGGRFTTVPPAEAMISGRAAAQSVAQVLGTTP